MVLLEKASLLAVLVVCCSYQVESSVSWIGTYNWAAVTTLGTNISFDCVLQDNGTDIIPSNQSVVTGSARWQLAGNTELQGPFYSAKNKKINGESLSIHNISMADKGIYLCHVELDCYDSDGCKKNEMWFKHGLNLNGPIYADLLEKYRHNIIAGCVAAASVTALFGLLCLVYKFRNKEPKESEDALKLGQYTGTAPPVDEDQGDTRM